MDTLEAIMMWEAHMGCELMIFDWDKAARLIKESGCKSASAGLADDWINTGGSIYSKGEPNYSSYTFLASTWAVPELRIGHQPPVECYKMQSETPGWDEYTKWPESALKILNGG